MILSAVAQNQYSRVKLFASRAEMLELASQGLSIDHGEFKAGSYVVCELSETELAIAERAGIRYEILIEDVSRFYEENT